MGDATQDQTAEATPPPRPDAPSPAAPASECLRFAADSHVGFVRDNNEDQYAIADLGQDGLFVLVCDGMGGHEAGEVASALAVEQLGDAMRGGERDPRDRLREGFLRANRSIIDEGKRIGRRGMGTTGIATLVQRIRSSDEALQAQGDPEDAAALADPGSTDRLFAWVGQVGDSRLFHIRQGHVLRRSKDHTRVQMLLDRGLITDDEARDHPDSGMLTRALGHNKMADGKRFEPEIWQDPVELEPGDALLLCSDGLHDLADDAEIGMRVAGRRPVEAVDDLIAVALERGGHDNVTIAVVVWGEQASPLDPALGPPPAPIERQDAPDVTADAAEVRSDTPPVMPEVDPPASNQRSAAGASHASPTAADAAEPDGVIVSGGTDVVWMLLVAAAFLFGVGAVLVVAAVFQA